MAIAIHHGDGKSATKHCKCQPFNFFPSLLTFLTSRLSTKIALNAWVSFRAVQKKRCRDAYIRIESPLFPPANQGRADSVTSRIPVLNVKKIIERYRYIFVRA